MISQITSLFPLWAILFSFIAYFIPQIFVPLKSLIIYLLSVIMFGMGMTLTWQNFKEVLQTPKSISVGVFLQFIIMPFAAFIISKILLIVRLFSEC